LRHAPSAEQQQSFFSSRRWFQIIDAAFRHLPAMPSIAAALDSLRRLSGLRH
jgi:hypothetical protein